MLLLETCVFLFVRGSIGMSLHGCFKEQDTASCKDQSKIPGPADTPAAWRWPALLGEPGCPCSLSVYSPGELLRSLLTFFFPPKDEK